MSPHGKTSGAAAAGWGVTQKPSGATVSARGIPPVSHGFIAATAGATPAKSELKERGYTLYV